MKWLSNAIHFFDRKKKRHYVSEIDQFLQDFDNTHPQKSASQLKEVNKHFNIFNRKIKSRINWD